MMKEIEQCYEGSVIYFLLKCLEPLVRCWCYIHEPIRSVSRGQVVKWVGHGNVTDQVQLVFWLLLTGFLDLEN